MAISYETVPRTALQCDDCGKTVHIRGERSRISVNRLARKSGWRVGTNGDLCPACLKKRLARVLPVASVILYLFLLAGCHQEPPEPLPTGIQNVGDTIIKEPDVLPTATDMPSGGGIPSSTGDEKTGEIRDISSDQAKEWVKALITGEYASTQDGAFYTQTANMVNGGTVAVNDFGERYYSTDFSLPIKSESAKEDAAACISAYIGRKLTDNESEELAQLITYAQKVKEGTDMELTKLESFGETAIINVMTQSNSIIIQCY